MRFWDDVGGGLVTHSLSRETEAGRETPCTETLMLIPRKWDAPGDNLSRRPRTETPGDLFTETYAPGWVAGMSK